MCGVTGILWRADRLDPAGAAEAVGRMTSSLSHRGPDGGDVWADPDAGVALGHRRLAVIDPSDAGRQPMASSDGRIVLTYNGEVYNFRGLAEELRRGGTVLRGGSDTEVLAELIARDGVEATVPRLNGIFAFAAWDREARTLWLARDHFGVKPLYWLSAPGLVAFASEPRAFRACPGWTPELDREAAAAFFRFGVVPAPMSILRGVRQLLPGSLLALRPGAEPEARRFWDPVSAARAAAADRLDLSDAEAEERLHALLSDAVAGQLVSDVPLGVLLSGGIDSSTVAALAQAASSRPVRSFSVGFDDGLYDEARHAAAVARRIGTDHAELRVDARAALDLVPRLAGIHDEPFADSSQIPTRLVSELARRHVTVALSGDGGDELFAGYNRYVFAPRAAALARLVPAALAGPARSAVRAVGARGWARVGAALPGGLRVHDLGGKLERLAGLAGARDGDAVYRRLVSHWPDDGNPVLGAAPPPSPVDDPGAAAGFPDLVERMQVLDATTYLPDDILTKVDRASMSVGLEARVPLLDVRVAEFAWRLPMRQRIRDGRTKWLLRRVLARHVPEAETDRPKMGFAAPIGEWMRGPLRDWCETLLDERRLRSAGILDPGPIRRRWSEHLAGAADHRHLLWDALMFESWRDAWLP
jgi:asparagine synthase (glutamine-hydrolysing)